MTHIGYAKCSYKLYIIMYIYEQTLCSLNLLLAYTRRHLLNNKKKLLPVKQKATDDGKNSVTSVTTKIVGKSK